MVVTYRPMMGLSRPYFAYSRSATASGSFSTRAVSASPGVAASRKKVADAMINSVRSMIISRRTK